MLAGALLLCGCSATRVTLLPDQSGHVGSVQVFNAKGEQSIDRAFESIVVDGTSAPSAPRAVEQEAFEKEYRALIDAQPTPPRTFVLHFVFDSMELTPESKKLLPEVLEVVRQRRPTEIAVFGYADAAGTHEYNLALSANRAQAVARMLKQIDPDLPIDVRYFGDRVPLVRTPPGVAEPRNRRAEIVVL